MCSLNNAIRTSGELSRSMQEDSLPVANSLSWEGGLFLSHVALNVVKTVG